MRKWIAIVFVLILAVECLPLCAEAGIKNAVPYGSAVQPAVNSAQQQTFPAAQQQTFPAAQQNPAAASAAMEVKVIGASVQYADKKGRPTGEMRSSVPVNGSVDVYVTADVPAGKKLSYWVFNGRRYDFDRIPKHFSIKNVTQGLTIEAVYGSASASTLLSASQIQAQRTGEALWIRTIHAQLCHLTNKGRGAGGWMTEFEFTRDYTNKATKKTEKGGQVTARVQAKVPKNKKISYWKFNDMDIDFDTNVTEFVVRTLFASMTYEPIFESVKTQKKEQEPPPPQEEKPVYYNVTCKNCSFSGGGYSNARSGKVLAGTRISVKADFLYVECWTVNGATQYIRRTPKKGIESIIPNQRSSLSITVNKDKTIVCTMQIN